MKFRPMWIAIGLVAFLGMAALVSADTVPIMWTGSPSVPTWECNGCPYGGAPPTATATEDGATADLAVSYFSSATGFGPSSSSTVTDTFTLTSPADVLLSLSVDYFSSGSSCWDFGCAGPGWDYSAEFAGDASISGPDGIDIAFGDSGTVPGICNGALGPGNCSGGMYLQDTESGMTELPAGTYTLTVNYSDSDTSVGDSSAGALLDVTLGDADIVPEPAHTIFVVILFLMVVALKANFKSI
jgi:hypothetical protein